MNEYQTGETFLFSGKFPLPLNFPDPDKVRHCLLFLQESRKDASEYFTNKTNPPETFLATFTECRDDYVYNRCDVRFPMQIFSWGDANSAQLYPYLHCFFKETYDRLAALGLPLSVFFPPFANADLFQPVNVLPQILKFVCYRQTAMSATIKYLLYDECADAEVMPPPPPPPPPPSPKFSAGSPITKEDGFSDRPAFTNRDDYKPDDLDTPDTPPIETGEACELLAIDFSVSYATINAPPSTFRGTLLVYGELVQFYVGPSIPGLNPIEQVYVTCRGLPQLNQPCGEVTTQPATNLDTSGGITNLTVFSITPVP